MAIASTRIHIICGLCGSNEMMEFEIHKELDDSSETDKMKDVVSLSCRNCNSMTRLDEIITEIKPKE